MQRGRRPPARSPGSGRAFPAVAELLGVGLGRAEHWPLCVVLQKHPEAASALPGRAPLPAPLAGPVPAISRVWSHYCSTFSKTDSFLSRSESVLRREWSSPGPRAKSGCSMMLGLVLHRRCPEDQRRAQKGPPGPRAGAANWIRLVGFLKKLVAGASCAPQPWGPLGSRAGFSR